ncbi:MAG: hypothetical protein QM739_11850 [Propionivibrio sp.]
MRSWGGGGVFVIVELVAQFVHGINRGQQRIRLEILRDSLSYSSSVIRAVIGSLRSRRCKRQMPDRLGRRSHLDFDVVVEAIQAIHQFMMSLRGRT